MDPSDEWKQYETEKTLSELSHLYSDTSYESDLFEIFKHLTRYERHIVYNESKNRWDNNGLRRECIITLINIMIHFKEAHGDSIFLEEMAIKHKIMVTSIFRKICIIMRLDQYNHQVSMNGNNALSLYHVITELDKFLLLL